MQKFKILILGMFYFSFFSSYSQAGETSLSPTLLVVLGSPNLKDSVSRKLSKTYIKNWTAKFPKGKVVLRDLAENRMMYVNKETIEVFQHKKEGLCSSAEQFNDLSANLIKELKAADTILFAIPMHNFTINVLTKAYFDLIARAGETFKYDKNGVKGLLINKKAIVITTSGGATLNTKQDFLIPYVQHFLNFIGIKDITFIPAPNTSISALTEKSINEATEQIQKII
jgi:FMN-dependent NADH-azoreductase